jgi:hypothetical protein
MIVYTNDQWYKDIADEIRAKTDTTEEMYPSQMAGKIGEVYEAGKKSEYDTFWDTFQENGKRKSYNRGFAGFGFDATNFYPKYDIKPMGDAQYMFYDWEYDRHNINLKERLEECGVALDLSGCKKATHMFGYGNFTEIPTCDFTGITESSTTHAFAYCQKLVSIEKVVINDTASFSSWFDKCNALENIRFEGAIGKDINFQWSTKLTHDSLMSIINALKDYSGDTSGTVWTCTLGNENLEKLTVEQEQIALNKGWVLE